MSVKLEDLRVGDTVTWLDFCGDVRTTIVEEIDLGDDSAMMYSPRTGTRLWYWPGMPMWETLQIVERGGEPYPPQNDACNFEVGQMKAKDMRRIAREINRRFPVTEDPVNHPTHYKSGGVEVIDFIEAFQLSYHAGNAVKYIARAGKKDPLKYAEDIQKAIWYLTRLVEKTK